MVHQNLRHLALILDGNRRWGRQRGIAMSVDFYVSSGLLGLDIARTAFERGIEDLTIWIGSLSNLTDRSALEIKALNKAYQTFFSDEANLEFLEENQIKVDCFGRWRELLAPATVAAIENALRRTENYNSGKRLTVLIGYDGNDERGEALRHIMESNAKPNSETSRDYANLLRQNSWTGHLPDVDLIIRTGCADDPHNSAGFLSLLVDHTQYAFLETLWPDFTPEMLNRVIDAFAERERRMGK